MDACDTSPHVLHSRMPTHFNFLVRSFSLHCVGIASNGMRGDTIVRIRLPNTLTQFYGTFMRANATCRTRVFASIFILLSTCRNACLYYKHNAKDVVFVLPKHMLSIAITHSLHTKPFRRNHFLYYSRLRSQQMMKMFPM